MSRSNDKCRPFFQVLKKAFHYEAQCEEAFLALKTYLSSPPVLVSPSKGELHLAISDFSISIALVRERDRIQQPVYYCNRALRGAKERYPKMEQLILALVTTARRLRPYFQAHNIEILTEHPMKQILHKHVEVSRGQPVEVSRGQPVKVSRGQLLEVSSARG